MDEITKKSLEVSADMILVMVSDGTLTSETVEKYMRLWHQIRQVIGYPTHYGL